MIKTKKQMYTVILSVFMLALIGSITYAFFNYTRTGTRNIVKTGNLQFTSSQDSTLTLTNVFPVYGSSVENDYTVDTLQIAITGSTTFNNGIEYLLTAEEINLETSTGKKIPLSLKVGVTGNLGTEDVENDQIDYFTDRGSTTSLYKKLTDSITYNNEYLLVGYIAPGTTGVNGVVNIKAYIDRNKVAISDTYDGTESDNMGTTNDWVDGRIVLTTEEWNSLRVQGQELSFKVMVQAYERVWVDDVNSRNDMINFSTANTFTSAQKTAFTKVTFIRMSEDKINKHANLIDLTASGGSGVVKAWIDNNELFIASPGETYFPVDSRRLFINYTNVTEINFYNVNTSLVTNMQEMFLSDTSLTSIDLHSFDTSHVTSMIAMFNTCQSLTTLDLSYLDTSSLVNTTSLVAGATNLKYLNLNNFGSNYITDAAYMFSINNSLEVIKMRGFNFGATTSLVSTFSNAPNVRSIDLSNANTTNVTSMQAMFNALEKLEEVKFDGIDTSNLTNMTGMFYRCISLKTVDLSSFDTSHVTSMAGMFTMANYVNSAYVPVENNLTTILVGSGWNTSSVSSSNDMFYNCTHLVGGQGTVFDSNHSDKTYARVDGGTSSPGYLTMKSS